MAAHAWPLSWKPAAIRMSQVLKNRGVYDCEFALVVCTRLYFCPRQALCVGAVSIDPKWSVLLLQLQRSNRNFQGNGGDVFLHWRVYRRVGQDSRPVECRG